MLNLADNLANWQFSTNFAQYLQGNVNKPVNKYMESNQRMQFMVDFTLPSQLSEEFVSRIPQQRKAVNRLLQEGKILNYALSLENSKLWAVFTANSMEELIETIEELPLTSYMRWKVNELTFFNSGVSFTPAFSAN
jgi:muconolactone delta-isomerase